LLDIGCSGGPEYEIQLAIDSINESSYLGVDPLVSEIKRLRELHPSSKYSFYDAYVSSGGTNGLFPNELSDTLYQQSQSMYSQRQINYSYEKEVFNSGQSIVYSENHYSVDQLINHLYHSNNNRIVDFVKIDTDGYDLEVLIGAQGVLENVALIKCEMQFHHNNIDLRSSNCFASLDTFLRRNKFQLAGIEVNRYRRSCLPSVFKYNILAQNNTGMPLFCDGIYINYGLLDSATSSSYGPFLESKYKSLLLLLLLYGLDDLSCQVALLLRQNTLDEYLFQDMGKYLDFCAIQIIDNEGLKCERDYHSLIDLCNRDPRAFFPS